MARRKSLEQLSAEELYALARDKEAEEQVLADQAKEQVAALKKQRTEMVREHAKALAAIDREIAQLQGGKAPRKARRSAGKTRRGELPAMALEAIVANGPIGGRELKELLDTQGLNTRYLAQCIAGLKKKGAISTPSRGVYQAA